MVIFDILQVSNDAKKLLVEAHVNQAKYFDGYKITDIFINTEEDFLESGVNEAKAIYHKEYPDKPTTIREVIEGDFGSHLLFVYIRVEPKANACTECLPCALDCKDTLGVTFDTGLLYNTAMFYIKDLYDTCNVSQGFADFILHWDAFKICIESEHYIDAVNMFKKLFKKATKSQSSNCSCYGTVSI